MPALLPIAASIVVPLCGSCQEVPWPAQDVPVAIDGDAYADTDPSALTDFRGALDGHGAWVDDPTYGTTWVPEANEVGPDFTPYVSAGHWEYQDDLVWVSDYEWGWVPFHYGRWAWIDGRGWSWIPGRAYAGAWVAWRTGDAEYAYVGWAPLAPEFGWRGGVAVGLGFAPQEPTTYVASGDLFAPRIATRVVTGDRAAAVASHTTPYVPAQPGVGRVVAHPVATPRAPAFAAMGIDPVQVVRTNNRGVARAVILARPSTAIAVGARPAVPHVVRVVPMVPRFGAYPAPRAVPVRAAPPRGRR